ncbi:helix-turn-helix domain-containing protein [Donghicola mangrovi]|uniref:AraC family transcriptional regulator n=1 Tax=Donghicola mangrovi TaxID=2729614 RepID=A0A850QE90_9RHOB|nr:AraC family transcriptional regulator [Donghicola mangrovi]NVO24735.1 AraC family transcriptional regulator [Donghicola mangrovi]
MPAFPIPVFVSIVLSFAALRLWQERQQVSMLALLLMVCAAQAMIIALAQHYGVKWLLPVQPVTAAMIPGLAWLAYQSTAVRRMSPKDLIHGVVPLAALLVLAVAPALVDLLLPCAFVGYGLAILIHALRGTDAQPLMQLGHGNMPTRVWVVIGAALTASAISDVLIVAAQIQGWQHLRPWIISVFSVGNLLLIGMLSLSPYIRTEEPPAPEPEPAKEDPDPELWHRVTTLMAQEKPYLNADLTLAQLARKLRVPAKTLSSTINRATGENVSRYVNAARIAEAQSALIAGKSVTEAMLSAGFNTKSNFNREFLRVSGASPSDWLKSQST